MYFCLYCNEIVKVVESRDAFDHEYGVDYIEEKSCPICGGGKLKELEKDKGYIVFPPNQKAKVIYTDEDLLEEIKTNSQVKVVPYGL